jgi:hypothetical protein
MHGQLTYFDGPRTPEQLAAADFAGQERIRPALSSLGQSSTSNGCAAATERRSS